MDQHWFDANPDPNFYFVGNPDPDPDPGRPTPSFTYLITALPLYNVLSFSSVSHVTYVFSIFDSILKFSGKRRFDQLFDFLGIDTDPDQPDPDQHAL